MSSELIIFGDSVGRGVVFDSLQNKYKFLKDNFAKLFSQSSGVPVSNYASFGCTVTKGVRIFERHLGEMENCGGVILEFGGNDCDYNWAQVSENPDFDHQPKTPMNEFKEAYIGLIAKVRAQGKEPVLMNLPPIEPYRYFKKISEGLSQKNILEWLGDEGRIYRWHEYYSNAIGHIGKETGTPVIDVRSSFLESRNCFDMLCEDGIHPNAKGHELISKIVGEQSKLLLA